MAVAAWGGANRANFGDLLEPGFRQIFFDQFASLPTVYDKIFKVNSSSKQDEKDSSVSGFGQLVQTSEGAPITYEDPIQGLTKTINYVVVLIKLSKLLETLKTIITNYVKILWNKTISRQSPSLISVG